MVKLNHVEVISQKWTAVKARDFELVEKGLKEAFELLGKKCIYERRS